MSYQDRYKKASFRGVPFLIENQEKTFGRRIQLHEYPFRDESFAEDLGLKADSFTISAYCIGSDYDLQRNNLENALAMIGAGELIHPSYGTMMVIPTNISVSEKYTNGKGMSRFSITFTKLGEILYPSVDLKSQTDLTNAIKTNRGNFLSQFPKVFSGGALTKVENIMHKVNSSMRSVASRIRAPAESLARIDNMIDDVEENVSYLVQSPEELVSAVEDVYAEIANVSGQATDQEYQSRETSNALYVNKNFDDNFEESIPITEEDQQVKDAEDALVSLNVKLSAIYFCDATLQIPYISSDEGENKINLINEWFFELENTNDTELFDALQNLRIQTTKAIAQLTENLTKSKQTTIHLPTPSLVLAHQNNMDEVLFVKINKIRDPLFVVGKVKIIPKV